MKTILQIIIGMGMMLLVSCSASDVRLYTIANNNGMSVSITNYGGRIVSIVVPDKDGKPTDVVLGFDDLTDYFYENNLTDFGATIGRYANRIDHGRFSIDGKEYQLPINNDPHSLHGGTTGWQYQYYKLEEKSRNSLTLRMDSPDGDNGYPGNVTAFVTFTVTDDNKLDLSYRATTDAPTIINMTNHSYFNLSGDPANHSICEDILYINASYYTPIDNTFMTTGQIESVDSTLFDFRTPGYIGTDINNIDDEQISNGNGYDHNWVLDTKGDITVPAVELYCEKSGISLTVYTDEPGVQVYSGNFLDGTVVGKKGVVYNHRTAICLETQHYPDSPNKTDWPSVVLRPGETYTSHCIYAFGNSETSIGIEAND